MKAPQKLIRFDEVAVVFSEEEWAHLDEQQRDLYKQVMLDNYQMLVSVCEPTVISKIQRGHEPWMTGDWSVDGAHLADIVSMNNKEQFPGDHISQLFKKNKSGCLSPSTERSARATLEKSIENRRELIVRLQKLPAVRRTGADCVLSTLSKPGLGCTGMFVNDKPKISEPVESSLHDLQLNTTSPNKRQCQHQIKPKLRVKVIKCREQPDNMVIYAGRGVQNSNCDHANVSMHKTDVHLTASGKTCAENESRTLFEKKWQAKIKEIVSHTKMSYSAGIVKQPRAKLTEAIDTTSGRVVQDEAHFENKSVPSKSLVDIRSVDTEKSSAHVESQVNVRRVDTEKSSAHVESQVNVRRVDTEKSSARAESQVNVRRVNTEKSSAHVESQINVRRVDTEKSSAHVESQINVWRVDTEKSSAHVESQINVRRVNTEKSSAHAESQINVRRVDTEKSSAHVESQVNVRRVDTEKSSAHAESQINVRRVDTEKSSAHVESQINVRRVDTEKSSAHVESQVNVRRVDTEKSSAHVESQVNVRRVDTEKSSAHVESQVNVRRVDTKKSSAHVESQVNVRRVNTEKSSAHVESQVNVWRVDTEKSSAHVESQVNVRRVNTEKSSAHVESQINVRRVDTEKSSAHVESQVNVRRVDTEKSSAHVESQINVRRVDTEKSSAHVESQVNVRRVDTKKSSAHVESQVNVRRVNTEKSSAHVESHLDMCTVNDEKRSVYAGSRLTKGSSDLQISPSNLNLDRALESNLLTFGHSAVTRNKKMAFPVIYPCVKDENLCKKETDKKSHHFKIRSRSEVNVILSEKDVTKKELCVEVKSQSRNHFNASMLKCSNKNEHRSSGHTAGDKLVTTLQNHVPANNKEITNTLEASNGQNMEAVLLETSKRPRKRIDLKKNAFGRTSDAICKMKLHSAFDRKKTIITYPGKRPCTCVLPTAKSEEQSDPAPCTDGSEKQCAPTRVTRYLYCSSNDNCFPKVETNEPYSKKMRSNHTGKLGKVQSNSKCRMVERRICRNQFCICGKKCKYKKLNELAKMKGRLCKYKEKYLKRKSKWSTKVERVSEECNKCRKKFSILVNKTRYQHSGKTWKTHACNIRSGIRRKNKTCIECKKMTRDKSVSSRKETYSCSDCGKRFLQRSVLLLHQNSHMEEKLFVCPSCGKRFVQHSLLILHQKTHKNNKPFQCMECGNMFFSRLLFLEHQRTHKEEKPHHCSDCGKCFADSTTLLIHQRIHTGEKPFNCRDCGKSFSQHSTLVSHQRIHTGEKPYECRQCGKRFSDRSAYVSHQRTHTGDKPFRCEDCGKRFSQSSNLRRHERLHTGQKPHVCSKCGKAFNEYTKLKSHENVHLKKESKEARK